MINTVPAPLFPLHDDPYYLWLQGQWHAVWHMREDLPWWRQLIGGRYDELTERLRDLNETLYFVGLNPWIAEYACA